MIVTAQTSGALNTNSNSWQPIAGLALKLPEGVGEQALLILNVPSPYATGNDFPGGNFGIQVNGILQNARASFTYSEQSPPSSGRMPTTLTLVAPLSDIGKTVVQAMWSNVRGSNVCIDSPAVLTAIIG